MYRELLSHTPAPLLALPIIAMFVFLAVFVSVLIRTMSRRASAYDDRASLPFSEETPHE